MSWRLSSEAPGLAHSRTLREVEWAFAVHVRKAKETFRETDQVHVPMGVRPCRSLVRLEAPDVVSYGGGQALN